MFKKDKGNGYMYCYDPKSEYANGAGKVYEHVYVMSRHLGRKLTAEECVHHIDHDKTNNSIENLELMSFQEHATYHSNDRFSSRRTIIKCPICSTDIETLSGKSKPRKFCSQACSYESKRKLTLGKEELSKLVWEHPMSKLSSMLNVSDKAIAKRCLVLGIERLPIGYWNSH